MSAFFAVAYPDRVELLTDGAIYLPCGTLTDIERKVWASVRHPIAVAGRGDAALMKALSAVLLLRADASGTVDEALESMQRGLDERARRPSEPVEFVICAISETRGPSIFYVTNGMQDVEPWALIDVGTNLGGGPAVDPEGLDASDGLRSCGVDLFERMRRIKAPNPVRPDFPYVHGVGGWVDLTVVRPDGVTTERIHEWPEDVVGEKIEPVVGQLRMDDSLNGSP